MSNPPPPPIQPPAPPPQGPRPEPSLTDKMIPTSNTDALIAYYLGLFGLLPPFGLILCPIAIVLGRRGLAKIKAEPGLPGKTHAKVGVGCGTASLIVNILMTSLIILALLNAPKK